jgi:hypothetical protein
LSPTCTTAVLGQEFGLRMELKPGVVPMFETMIFRSFAAQPADDVLDLPNQVVGQLQRVPVGAFTLMTNWLGSVRGK